jgi:choline dehydrogenase-like flavoprotein
VIAGELAERGRCVLLLETGPHKTAADFTRWEAKAAHDLWWPIRFALIDGGAGGAVALLGGRCVGGTTTINTKVALRAHDKDLAKWRDASGLALESSDLSPHYDRVEQRLGVRERTDWRKSVRTVEPAFRKLGAPLEPVRSYTDANCMSCGSCLQGCPTNAGKSTLNTYIHDAWAAGKLELRADARVERVLVEDGEAKGVDYVDGDGSERRVDAGAVVVAAGTLNTPQLLLRSELPDSPSSRLVGHHLGFHPVRLVYGLFDEPQDAHMVYPITAHSMAHQHDEDGGFVIEATTIQDPVSFATTLEDENGPLWGPPLVEAVRGFRHWVGVLAMVNDENNGVVRHDENGHEAFDAPFNATEQERMAAALDFSREVLLAAGASRVLWTGLASTHVQGSCRMGSDPERSVVDPDGQSWDVKRLYVGDGSVVPRTLSVNPSLTIMALASRLAGHLDADPHGYLS